LVNEGPDWIERLQTLGVPFGDDANLEAGHSRRRIHQVGGARTGHAIVATLGRLVRSRDNVQITIGERALALWMRDEQCIGVRTDRRLLAARATILATGGYASLFDRTTNPPGSVGRGQLLAFTAGAALADLEFVQFHPTVLADGNLLLTEALRGDGAQLLDDHGERFTDELAPRDVVARAIFVRGRAWLDLRSIRRERFEGLMLALRSLGLDPARNPIPVAPAAHYTMGGIVTDLNGRTTIPGLFAAGECACSGVHGANRLASNSLLECLVFGARAAREAGAAPVLPVRLPQDPIVGRPPRVTAALRRNIWRHAGVIRDAEGLAHLSGHVTGLPQLIAAAALARNESRGSHYRSDATTERAELAGHFVFRRGQPPQLQAWT
jgi:L-aspartate oxidase